jgi:hypothetical protein
MFLPSTVTLRPRAWKQPLTCLGQAQADTLGEHHDPERAADGDPLEHRGLQDVQKSRDSRTGSSRGNSSAITVRVTPVRAVSKPKVGVPPGSCRSLSMPGLRSSSAATAWPHSRSSPARSNAVSDGQCRAARGRAAMSIPTQRTPGRKSVALVYMRARPGETVDSYSAASHRTRYGAASLWNFATITTAGVSVVVIAQSKGRSRSGPGRG